jgi:hypothetical protein
MRLPRREHAYTWCSCARRRVIRIDDDDDDHDEHASRVSACEQTERTQTSKPAPNPNQRRCPCKRCPCKCCWDAATKSTSLLLTTSQQHPFSSSDPEACATQASAAHACCHPACHPTQPQLQRALTRCCVAHRGAAAAASRPLRCCPRTTAQWLFPPLAWTRRLRGLLLRQRRCVTQTRSSSLLALAWAATPASRTSEARKAFGARTRRWSTWALLSKTAATRSKATLLQIANLACDPDLNETPLASRALAHRSFRENPAFGWGFFGHRYQLYSGAEPHEGYNIMLKWGRAASLGYHVFTSNVDGCARPPRPRCACMCSRFADSLSDTLPFAAAQPLPARWLC